MAQLIAMRQRIKAIETIKKITHAMRLISMSTHTQLKNKQEALDKYSTAIKQITTLVKSTLKTDNNTSTVFQSNQDNKLDLIILVGSEKGLCGNFNNQLFKFFELKNTHRNPQAFIPIGKFAVDYALSKKEDIVARYKEFNSANFITIADKITNYILENTHTYNTITVYSNYPKTFFSQKPEQTQIAPLAEDTADNNKISVHKGEAAEYLWEQSPEELYKKLQELHLRVVLQRLLYNSLLAEQAARFVSMDSSTRNAESLLDKMKLEYNKERQGAITRELTELIGSFL